MHMLQALFVYPTPEGKGQHFGILIQICRYKHEKHGFSAASMVNKVVAIDAWKELQSREDVVAVVVRFTDHKFHACMGVYKHISP